MQHVLGFYVYDSEAKQWLDDEDRYQHSFHAAAEFSDAQTANDAMERTGGDYVFACMGSM
jgi:hypothetical protein